MADGTIALDEPAVTDKLLDTEQLTVGVNTVQRERMRIAGATATQLAPVDATAGLKVDLGADNDVTIASLPLPSGAATEATLAGLDAKVTAVNTGAVVVSSSALPTGASTLAEQQTQTTKLNGGLPAALGAGGGLKVDGSGTALPVSAASLPLPTGASTLAEQQTQTTSLQLIDDTIFVDDAAFTVGTSKVNASGIQAVAHGANPDAADAGDAVIPIANRHRVPFVIGGHPFSKSATYLWTGATTDDNVLPTIAGGTKYAVTRISITIDEATTVGVAVRLGFGTASVPALPSANADAVDDILFYHPGMVPGSGANVGDGSGILGVGGDGAELRITAEATTSGTGVVTVTYFTIES